MNAVWVKKWKQVIGLCFEILPQRSSGEIDERHFIGIRTTVA
jgi:hypothetical protein